MKSFKLLSVLFLFVRETFSQTFFTEFSVINLSCYLGNNSGIIIWQRHSRYLPQCVLMCEQRTNCKSIGYDDSNNNCMAFTQVLPEVNVSANCGRNIKYAEKVISSVPSVPNTQSLVIPVSPIEKTCSDDSECTVLNSVCYVGVCKCMPGYSYDQNIVLCVQYCSSYGNTFQYYPGKVLAMNSVRSISDVSEYACAQECLNEMTFICRSFDYLLVVSSCHLSVETAATMPGSLYDVIGINYRQRDCL